MYPMAEFLREKRLIWFGHVQMRDKDDATRNILPMTVDGKRNRGRPKLFQKQRVLCAEHAQTKSAPKPLQNTPHGKPALALHLFFYSIVVSADFAPYHCGRM